MQKPIQRVKFAKAIARHTKIRDQNPSLGMICPGEPHQRSTNAPKFDDRFQEETVWQEQGAREAAWKLAKSVFKLKEKNKATFFSPSENRCLPASTLEPEEREFVVGYSYEWINGEKPHLIQNDNRIQCNTENFVPVVVPGLSTTPSSSSTSTPMTPSGQEINHSDHHPATESSECVDTQARGDPFTSETSEELLHEPTKTPKPNKNEDHEQVRGDPCSDIPERLQQFRENLVDDRVPERRDSHASSSHEPSLEPTPSRCVDLGNHSVYTHFPKDRNCEICQRTKITRARCRRRIGRAVPRAENFGDLITADHKVFSEGCESRNNHRCSRGARLGYSMDPVVSVQNKNFSGNRLELAKVLGAE